MSLWMKIPWILNSYFIWKHAKSSLEMWIYFYRKMTCNLVLYLLKDPFYHELLITYYLLNAWKVMSAFLWNLKYLKFQIIYIFVLNVCIHIHLTVIKTGKLQRITFLQQEYIFVYKRIHYSIITFQTSIKLYQ